MPGWTYRSRTLRYRVMAQQCETCIFGPNSPISTQRLAEIQSYLLKGTTHLCHKPMLHEEKPKQNMACRGGRDFQLQMWYRMGLLETESDDALEQRMRSLGISYESR